MGQVLVNLWSWLPSPVQPGCPSQEPSLACLLHDRRIWAGSWVCLSPDLFFSCWQDFPDWHRTRGKPQPSSEDDPAFLLQDGTSPWPMLWPAWIHRLDPYLGLPQGHMSTPLKLWYFLKSISNLPQKHQLHSKINCRTGCLVVMVSFSSMVWCGLKPAGNQAPSNYFPFPHPLQGVRDKKAEIMVW